MVVNSDYVNGPIQSVFKEEVVDESTIRMKVSKIAGYFGKPVKQLIAEHEEAHHKIEALQEQINKLGAEIMDKLEEVGPRERRKLHKRIYDSSTLHLQVWTKYFRPLELEDYHSKNGGDDMTKTLDLDLFKDIQTDGDIPAEFECIGKMDEIHPGLNDDAYRTWIWENADGQRIATWDLGNSHCSFMCEGTESALKEYFAKEAAKDEQG